MNLQSTTPSPAPARKPWTAPAIETLPRLTNLTLDTQVGETIDGAGDTGNPGGSVFS